MNVKIFINPEWLWQWIPFPLQWTVSMMVMCFEFQQMEVYQFTAKPSIEPASLKSPGCFSSRVAQPEAGPATFRWWTGVFKSYPQSRFCASGCSAGLPTVPCQRVYTLTWKDQLRVRKQCILRVHLVLVWLAETVRAVDGPEAQGSRESSPVMEANPVNWQCIHSAFPTSTHEIPTPTETEHHEPLNDFSLLPE